MYKTIIFDLGKVLIDFDFKRGYRALNELCPYTVAEIPKRIGTTDLVQRFEKGLIEPRDFFAQLSELLGLDIGYTQFRQIWSCIFMEPLVPESMLEGLAARYRLLLLSNTNAIHFEMVRDAHPMLRHFHELVLSYEVKSMKPETEIFRAALDRAQCRPEECLFTDDISENIEAARQLGIDAVMFQSTEQLQRELRARGIKW